MTDNVNSAYFMDNLAPMSVEDLCGYLNIGYNAAYRLLSSGVIKSFRIGKTYKIPPAAVREYIIKQSRLGATTK